MKIYRTLRIGADPTQRTISFGQADRVEEIEEINRLRYRAYLDRGYIDGSRYPDMTELDEYDKENKCKYFFARLDGRVIGCIRLIVDDPLPTELYFKFTEPQSMSSIFRNQRCELGRFIIVPPNKEKGDYLPRGLVMLFMFDTVLEFATNSGLEGGYSFIKMSLEKKMKRLKMPIGNIRIYEQNYPQDGVLTKYFSQPDDPVVPIYFIAKDFISYTSKQIHSSLMFKKENEVSYVLKVNLYTQFLKTLKLI